jgi:aconitate hydratase
MTVAALLRKKQVHPDVSLVISPGSKQVFQMIAKNGALADIIQSGARILEAACGPCIGMGQAPPTSGISVRTFNRNFEGRSGTRDGLIYLASPEVAVTAALTGKITDPRRVGKPVQIKMPERFDLDDTLIVPPLSPEEAEQAEIIRGPNIKPLPTRGPLTGTLKGDILLKVGDNITTDHIMPAGAKILPLRSNIPAIAEHVFEGIDPMFSQRAQEAGGGFIVGGGNYGQGSSREHAALAPMYLGVKAVLVKSFARIHLANLINFGILPLTFANTGDYERLEQGDLLEIPGTEELLREGKPLVIKDPTRKIEIPVLYNLTNRQRELILAGGLLNYTRERATR